MIPVRTDQHLPRQLLTTAEQAHQARVVDTDFVPLTALAAKAEPGTSFAQESEVAITQRGQAVRAVAAAIFFIANSK